MPSYIETTLTKGENVLYSAKVSIFLLVPSFLIGLILVLISPEIRFLGFLVWMVGLARFVVVFSTTELGITNKRLIAKFGLFTRETIELNLSKIESVQVSQGIFGRALNYGNIIVRGSGGTPAPIPNISDPIAFRKAFSAIGDEVDSGRNAAVAQTMADSLGKSVGQTGVGLTPQGDTIFCTECGVRSSAMASFCSKCGNKIVRIA